MKRIIAAIVCLLISAGFCTAELCYIKRSTEKFISSVEQIEKDVTNGEKESALNKAKTLNKEWDKNIRITDMLLFHDYVYSIGTDIVTLESFIANDEEAEIFATCEKVKHQLRILFDNEKPTPENIL